MLKSRIIPCLDVKDGRTVKGVNFVDLRDAGDPVALAKAYDAAGADELANDELVGDDKAANKKKKGKDKKRTAAAIRLPQNRRHQRGRDARRHSLTNAMTFSVVSSLSAGIAMMGGTPLVMGRPLTSRCPVLYSPANVIKPLTSTRFAVTSQFRLVSAAVVERFVMSFVWYVRSLCGGRPSHGTGPCVS